MPIYRVIVIRTFGILSLVGIGGSLLWEIGQAQKPTKQEACVENARLLARATMLYAQDYDEFLPPMKSADTFQKGVLPYVVIASSVKLIPKDGKVFDPTHIEKITEDADKVNVKPQNKKVFLCPVTGKRYLLNAALSKQIAFFMNNEVSGVNRVENASGFPQKAAITWLFRDAIAHKDGLSTIVFADTHVERKKLRTEVKALHRKK